MIKAALQNGLNKVNIVKHQFETDMGSMIACATGKGLCLLEFSHRRALDSEFEDLVKRLEADIVPGQNKHTQAAEMQIKAYFAGELQDFNLELDLVGTDFQKTVWCSLLNIPYGSTWSYKQQAESMNKIKAVRAVANANGKNKVSIVVPCHRVIGSDGSLTGYGGGLQLKQQLLDLENK